MEIMSAIIDIKHLLTVGRKQRYRLTDLGKALRASTKGQG
jgi:hypothetical protein